MEVLLYFGLPIKNEHDDFSCPQKFIAYPQPHEILKCQNQESGFIFLNKYGDRITTRGISGQLKKLAMRYNIDPSVVYPHSFRHRFAKSFLERCNDIAFLADLMGHESIETTRIYLRKTATEQREIIDNIIDW